CPTRSSGTRRRTRSRPRDKTGIRCSRANHNRCGRGLACGCGLRPHAFPESWTVPTPEEKRAVRDRTHKLDRALSGDNILHRRYLMRNPKLRLFLLAIAALLLLSAAIHAADTLPPQIPDDAYWQLIEKFSEPGGAFQSENFLSNETGFQSVIPTLKETA